MGGERLNKIENLRKSWRYLSAWTINKPSNSLSGFSNFVLANLEEASSTGPGNFGKLFLPHLNRLSKTIHVRHSKMPQRRTDIEGDSQIRIVLFSLWFNLSHQQGIRTGV
jgi:hypothetical protein